MGAIGDLTQVTRELSRYDLLNANPSCLLKLSVTPLIPFHQLSNVHIPAILFLPAYSHPILRLHFDPDSKPRLSTHHLVKKLEKSFTELESLQSKRGIANFLAGISKNYARSLGHREASPLITEPIIQISPSSGPGDEESVSSGTIGSRSSILIYSSSPSTKFDGSSDLGG